MSDRPPNRPSGAPDINELKARLGLSNDRPRRPSQVQGVVVPPGAPAPPMEDVPPPTGAAVPAPTPGAAPPPVAVSAAPALPVDTGGPVASVGKKSFLGTIGKLTAIAVVPLVVGVAVGQIGAKAARYNDTIESSGHIVKDVQVISQNLVDVQQALERARDRAGGSYKLNDETLVKDLDETAMIEPNRQVVYNNTLYEFPPSVIEDIMSFYHGTAALQRDVAVFVERTKASGKATKEGLARWVMAQRGGPYAGLLEMPKGEETLPRVRLVQLGPPICPGKSTPNPNGCGEGVIPDQSQYRLSLDGNWGRKAVSKVEGTAITGDTLIPFSPETTVFQQLVRGGEASVVAAAYNSRITKLQADVEALLALRVRIQDRLSGRAEENKKFSFFL